MEKTLQDGGLLMEQNFQKAKQNFLQKDMKAAADEIRKAAAYLKSEADAATGKGKEALTASYQELEKLAGDVEKGTVASVKKLDAAFARSYKALATNSHVKSTESWARKEISNTGKHLETAADYLERGYAWTGEKMKAGTKKVVEESRVLSQKLKDDTGWVTSKVSKGLKDMAEPTADAAPAPKKPAARKASAKSTKTAGSTNATGGEPSSARFARAIEEAKAGTRALARETQERATAASQDMLGKADAYRARAAEQGGEWLDDAKALGEQAREKAVELANEGKARTSGALSSLGKIVADNAATIDEKVGGKYGDYARQAARSLEETATRLDAKDLNELGEDAKEFVRKSPGLAIGIAAAAGFMISRLFKKSQD